MGRNRNKKNVLKTPVIATEVTPTEEIEIGVTVPVESVSDLEGYREDDMINEEGTIEMFASATDSTETVEDGVEDIDMVDELTPTEDVVGDNISEEDEYDNIAEEDEIIEKPKHEIALDAVIEGIITGYKNNNPISIVSYQKLLLETFKGYLARDVSARVMINYIKNSELPEHQYSPDLSRQEWLGANTASANAFAMIMTVAFIMSDNVKDVPFNKSTIHQAFTGKYETMGPQLAALV